jgi:vancomycin resistance protein YoaR
VLGVAAVPLVEPLLPASPHVVGLVVGGERLPDGADARAWLERRNSELCARQLTLRHGAVSATTSVENLGGSIDIDATLAAMRAIGHEGSVFKRMRETRAARRGAVDVPIVHRLDEGVAAAWVEKLADRIARDPVDAKLDLDNQIKIDEVPGERLDVDATLDELRSSFFKTNEVSLVTRAIPPKVTVRDLGDVDVAKTLSSYETRFSLYQNGRAINVVLAASKIDGTLLLPGQEFSFNDKVGPRTRERGFREAPEILGDEMTVGIGGGTCQVASTLHAAALYGGLEIPDRQSHSRPSGYAPLGLDATVSYGKVDLKLKNPYKFPVIVHAWMSEPGMLRVELLGGEAVDNVVYRYGVGGIENFVRRITRVRWLKEGKFYRKQKGTRGMHVHSYVTIHYKDGRKEERRYYSGYRPTPEVFYVADDYNESELPPLPEHAKGIEGRLEEDGSDVYAGG